MRRTHEELQCIGFDVLHRHTFNRMRHVRPRNKVVVHFERMQYDEAADLLAEPAAKGNPEAQFYLGRINESGLGSASQDTEKAADFYHAAAKQGNTRAMVRLADLQLAAGNQESAISWLNLGARRSDPDAVSRLVAMDLPVPAPYKNSSYRNNNPTPSPGVKTPAQQRSVSRD